MFLGIKPGSIGEVAVLLIIVCFVFLLLRRVIKWHIPVSIVATVALISYLFPPQSIDAVNFVTYQLLSGGLIFGAVFMATDYSTTPITRTGKMIFALGCGLITFLIRYYGSYPEGVSFSILFMNILSPYIEKWTAKRPLGGK
jgi:electron transport complex protein RnfD